MVEGDSDNHYDWRTGNVYRCYWEIIASREYLLSEESSLSVSGEECLQCSLEKCLECNNYLPSTKTYNIKKLKKSEE